MEPCCLTIHELRDLMRKGELSPVEVVQSYLARIAAVEDRIQAYNTLTGEAALDLAKKAEAQQARREGLPPLAGVPLAIKDVICTKGVTTTCSSRILAGYVPAYNATVMDRLESAGALLLGKTNMDEFAMGSSTENSAFKKTRNPWSLDCVPGGAAADPRRPWPPTCAPAPWGATRGVPSGSPAPSAASRR